MPKIIRTPTRAKGGITPDEKKRMDEITKKWTEIAFKTGPIDKEKITQAIYDLYAKANLEKPRVVIVPSPLVMAFAYGLSAGWWYTNKHKQRAATKDATEAATYAETFAGTVAAIRAATRNATDAATRNATEAATDAATDNATYAATYNATYAATKDATDNEKMKWLFNLALYFSLGDREVAILMINCIHRWYVNYQGGNMWAAFPCYAETIRDVIGLSGLKCWKNYDAWERAAMNGGFRVMHKEFCIVSEFPEYIKRDSQGRSHCSKGPSHRWRDGFEIYHLNGIRVPKWLVMTDAGKIDPQLALTEKNVDVQREIIRKVGAEKMLKFCNAKTLDMFIDKHSKNGNKYELMEMKIGNIDRKYLYFEHASLPGLFYAQPVHPELNKAIHARAWMLSIGEPAELSKMSDDEIRECLPLEVA